MILTSDLDDDDFNEFIEGIVSYLRLPPEEAMKRIQENPRDGLSTLVKNSDGSLMLSTSTGRKRLRALVKRRFERLEDAWTLDIEEVFTRIGETTVPMLRKATVGQSLIKVFEDVFQAAIEESRANRKTRTHHFPCVLTSTRVPARFDFGPVRFCSAEEFANDLKKALQEQPDLERDLRIFKVSEYYERYGWIVSIKTGRMSKDAAQNLAELTGRTAINIIRVWFGLSYGRRMRLVHLEPATSNKDVFLVEEDGKLSTRGSSTGEAAIVMDAWLDQVSQRDRNIVGHFLMDLIRNQKSDLQERLVDSLSWFGDATFEPSPGAKIIKLATLLERLTTLGHRFSKRRFCTRLALLCSDNDNDFEQIFWIAYDFYNARSSIVHGSQSQDVESHWSALQEGEKLATKSILGYLQLFAIFKFGNAHSPRSLQGYFDKESHGVHILIQRLEKEMVSRDRQRGF